MIIPLEGEGLQLRLRRRWIDMAEQFKTRKFVVQLHGRVAESFRLYLRQLGTVNLGAGITVDYREVMSSRKPRTADTADMDELVQ
jgi:hypothetical protein